jgi:hypothetical protein
VLQLNPTFLTLSDKEEDLDYVAGRSIQMEELADGS